MSISSDLEFKFEVKSEGYPDEEELCRFCAEKSTQYSSIFNGNLHESLTTHLGVSVQESDNWPKFICKECLEAAKVSLDFISKIRRAEATLRGLFGELGESILMKPEIEVVDMKDVVSGDDNVVSSAESEESSSVPLERRRGRPRKKEKKGEIRRKGTGVVTNRRSPSALEEEDRRIKEFFKLECEKCGQSFEKLREFRAHGMKVHQEEAFLVCCDKKLENRMRIITHLNSHTNPNAFKCTKCEKTFLTKIGLMKHDLNKHVPPEEHIYKCPKCPSTFMTLCRARAHEAKHMKAEEKKFKCSLCDKAYAFNAMLRQHMRHAHEESNKQVCEVCAKVFKSKYTYQIHMTNHMDNGSRDFACSMCDKAFKRKRLLKVHMERHNKSGEIFKCDMCGKEAPNRTALRNHIQYSHMKVRKYECKLCSSAFKTPLGLREHVATHSSSQILYTCLFCPKQFNSNANKYVHQKRKHPVEYEVMKQKKNQ